MVNCNNFVSYRIPSSNSLLHGLKAEKEGYYYKWISYNKFEEKMSKIPELEMFNVSKTVVQKYYCGSLKDFIPNPDFHSSLSEYSYYLTHKNGGRPFCVFIKDLDVIIYRMEEEKYHFENWEEHPCFYTKKVAHFSAREIFIGKSPKNKMTIYSGGYGKWADGNSILLWIKDDKYVFIGESIFSFKTLSKVVKYVSPVGNSDVPYPYAIDENGRSYLLIENVMIDRKIKGDPYSYYYRHNRFGRFTYFPDPGKNYDRLKKYNDMMNGISRKEFIKLSTEYGKKMGFEKLK